MERGAIKTTPYMDVEEKKWFAVQTKYKCEKYVAHHLDKKQIVNYCPLITEVKVYASKRKKVEKPLINCYVFVYVNQEEYIKVLQTEYVYGFLKQGKEIIRIPEEEMDILKRVVGECDDVDVSDHTYIAGEKVEIIAGNLTGIIGYVIEEEGKSNLLVNLDKMGVNLRVTINKNILRPLHHTMHHIS